MHKHVPVFKASAADQQATSCCYPCLYIETFDGVYGINTPAMDTFMHVFFVCAACTRVCVPSPTGGPSPCS